MNDRLQESPASSTCITHGEVALIKSFFHRITSIFSFPPIHEITPIKREKPDTVNIASIASLFHVFVLRYVTMTVKNRSAL